MKDLITFEKGIYLLGGQPILFPDDTLSGSKQSNYCYAR